MDVCAVLCCNDGETRDQVPNETAKRRVEVKVIDWCTVPEHERVEKQCCALGKVGGGKQVEGDEEQDGSRAGLLAPLLQLL